jgi:complement component 1 Q subcomponent-binding protein
VSCREPAGECEETTTSPRLPLTQLSADLELAEKFNAERTLELESNDESKVAAIEEFLQNSPFKIQDKPGTHEVILTRDFGNEKWVEWL